MCCVLVVVSRGCLPGDACVGLPGGCLPGGCLPGVPSWRCLSIGISTCHVVKDNMEWQVMFEACSFIQRLRETIQFSGLLANCLAWSEPWGVLVLLKFD